MSGQLQFGGNVPFLDRRTNTKVEVRVWGVFAGSGVDPHEEQPIKEWIMNALASSALAFDGDVYQLPTMVGEWGAYISQQISPQLAQHFNAHGQLQILGVQVQGGAPAKASAPQAPMMQPAAAGGSLLEAAAAALSARMGVPPDQARQAAAIVLEVAQSGGAGAHAKDPYAKDPNAKDPYAKDPYAKDAYGKDAYGKDPYGNDPHAKDPYGKEPDWKK